MPTTNGISEKSESLSPKGYNDLLTFSKELLEYHKIKIFDFGDFHKEVTDVILRNRYVAIQLPVGHLKTTLVSLCYPIWKLFSEENHEICLVSATLELSMDNLEKIQYFIENTPWLKNLAPEDRSFTWNRTQLVTTNHNKCYVRAFRPSARGIQPNEIIYDDILREADISMEDIKDIFWHIFFPRGQTKMCKHIIVGTPISNDDLFVELDNKPDWAKLKYPAIITENGVEKPLWKERFTLQELHSIKENMGQYRFNREYLCNPAAAGSGFYPAELVLNTTDDNLSFSYSTKGRVFIGADFAMSDSPSGDYNVFTVIDAINDPFIKKYRYNNADYHVAVSNPVIIRHIERYKGSTGQVSKLENLYNTFHPEKIIVDSSSFGQRFAQELRSLGLPVDAQDFRPANRNNLLINLRRLFETDDPLLKPARLIIPTSQNDFTYSKTKILIQELSGFVETKTPAGTIVLSSKTEHDDTVMSLALAVKDISSPKKMMETLFYGV